MGFKPAHSFPPQRDDRKLPRGKHKYEETARRKERDKCGRAKELQSRLIPRDPRDRSPLDSSVHGSLQARILEWVAFPFSRGSSQPRDRTQVSLIVGRLFTN